MPQIKKTDFQSLIKNRQFSDLFISELGWNRYKGHSDLPTIKIDDKDYDIKAIAERNGFQILTCLVDELPTQSVAKKIDSKLRNQAADYICIFSEKGSSKDSWVVPVRTNDKRVLVLVDYEDGKVDFLFSKIEGFAFDFEEETNIVDLRAKVQGAFAINSEKITKDFYTGFKKEHKTFADFITGIDDHIQTKDNKNKQWYTSVMLNRLMFCYFIQKKGFLNFDTNYLKSKLDFVRASEGENKFYNFYRSFLCQLFSDGLNAPRHSKEFEHIFGKIPYLNGGMFDRHQLENEYPDIDIPDEAFIRLFDFFDKWNWHLDTRITASGRDINPDVLGYIFEQYINDRAQMGAYYTKEDITEYIGRNCILPFLFDQVKSSTKDAEKDFKPDGFVWKTLRESGDKYIFAAVKKGYKDFDEIPDEIKRGIITESMRKEYSETPIGELPDDHVPLSELRKAWNRPTPERWGLPTEIWRETIERLQRCDDILHKIERGEITSINDFITYNLDIRNFAIDLLASADSVFVKRFYHALQKVSILDPTCGSGAFLFAAMNILEPLYEICIERMQEFNRSNPAMFKMELVDISNKYRSNIQYFIFKSIILRNLYGVDIMVEATEIAKLRLFLKMVAVVDVDRRADNLGLDPLPDIDFNIRCGNTLVGYANETQLDSDLGHAKDIFEELANQEFKEKIENELKTVSRAYEIFKVVQLRQEEDMEAFKMAKTDLSNRLKALNHQLNQRNFLASTGYQLKSEENLENNIKYKAWLASHQPFNWLAEFYQIIQANGGFDVIIGNPPYVEISKVSKLYRLTGYKTIDCGNLYTCVYERSEDISNNRAYLGMIVQLPIVCTDRMYNAQEILLQHNSWLLTFDDRPGKLFDDLTHIRATIFLVKKSEKGEIFSSQYNRWYSKNRNSLFQNIQTQKILNVRNIKSIPKIGYYLTFKILSKLIIQSPFNSDIPITGQNYTYFHNAPQYFCRATTFQPHFWNEVDGEKLSVSIKIISSKTEIDANVICAILNSGIFYFWFILFSDCRHLNMREIENFPISYPTIDIQTKLSLKEKNVFLMSDFENNKNRKTTNYKTTGMVEYDEYFPKLSKPIIDEIDKVLAKHYGFTDEELDFIINYDIKYRMGDELNAE